MEPEIVKKYYLQYLLKPNASKKSPNINFHKQKLLSGNFSRDFFETETDVKKILVSTEQLLQETILRKICTNQLF